MNFSRRKSRQSLTGGEICYCVNCDFRNIMSRYAINSGMNETSNFRIIIILNLNTQFSDETSVLQIGFGAEWHFLTFCWKDLRI